MSLVNQDAIAARETDLASSELDIAPGMMSDLMMLTKARLSTLVLITTFVGFCMASGEKLDCWRLILTLLGTALVAGSAGVFNQVLESKVDRLMDRTKDRPLPAGRMRRSTAILLGGLMAAAGIGLLAWFATFLAAALSAATLFIYLALYTPMKRRTSFCISIGAVAGAIPPMIGWTAVEPEIGIGAWILFGILFFWQIPHFLAIAWMYRDEYAQAGFVMLRRRDFAGQLTAAESLLCTIALIIITLLPVIFHMATPLYLAGSLLCNTLLLVCAIQFLLHRTRPSARRLFFASIIYLPSLLGLMVFTKA
jgi:heme o synthase